MKSQDVDSTLDLKARTAGSFFLLSVVTAVAGEFLLHGRASTAAGLIAVACYVVVTFEFYGIFKQVDRKLAVLAISFNFAGLALEAARWNPGGVDVAMVLHGVYCLLIGRLIYRSKFLATFFATTIASAGVTWLLYVSPSVANHLSPYNTVFGLVGEALPCLWFLVMGLDVRQLKLQAAAPR
jgi:hypothetical protein